MEIGIFIYDGVEVLDFSGPFEVFSTAARFIDEPVNISLIAPSHAPVSCRGGLSVNPHYSIHGHPRFDLLVVAGGQHQHVINNTSVLAWLAETATHTRRCASICTGVFLFAEAGLIDGKSVTTHWDDVDLLQTQYPHLKVLKDTRFVMDQNFTSSAGISAGIDMSLELVKLHFGKKLAEKTARQMDYNWL